MFELLVKKSHVSCFENSRFKNLFEDYLSYLTSRGYADNTVQIYLGNVRHFVNWLGSNKDTKLQITKEVVNEFICKHLPTCTCLSPNARYVIKARSALKLMLKTLGINKIHRTISANPYIDTVIKK